MNLEEIKKQAKIELARRRLFDFCQVIHPRFYLEERTFLKNFCDQLQDFIENSDKRILVVNMPPRHGKSLTATSLAAWLFGKNPENRIITASYNETLSTLFARTVRNTIRTLKAGENIVFSDIFPKTKIKYGEASAQMWSLEGSAQPSYLATSPTGTATGMGGNFLIIDDIIKNHMEAYNERVLNEHWDWFNNTMMSRVEGENYKIIVIMTRWANGDLAGRILENFEEDVEKIEFPAVNPETGEMLCESILSREKFEKITHSMNLDIVEANYNQKPIDVAGRLFSSLMEWESLPDSGWLERLNFTDTADTGTDFLCSINGISDDKNFYITDLVFTDEPMEITEPAVAELLHSGEISTAFIESNNGGRGFARNVERILENDFRNRKVQIEAVPQTKNKESRILASSAWVSKNVFFPPNWKQKFPEFARQVLNYQKKGKNAHDDAPDVLASIYEYMTSNKEIELIGRR